MQGTRYHENPFPKPEMRGNPAPGQVLTLEMHDAKKDPIGALDLSDPFSFYIPTNFSANRIQASNKTVSALSSVTIDMKMPVGVNAIRLQIFIHQISLSRKTRPTLSD